MGTPKDPDKVRLVIGVLATDEATALLPLPTLVERFGPVDLEMQPVPFAHTNYYKDELGEHPVKAFWAFENLMDRSELPQIKLWTNHIEAEYNRKVNLDPGYMTLGQFFLATTKNQRHRVYVGSGIFMEVTLYFEGGKFHPFEWTYPDYQSPAYLAWLNKARERLAYQMTTGRPYRLRKNF
jgi:hypothetical protein